MKNITLLVILSLIMFGCTVTEKPEFIKVNSVEVIDASFNNFTLLTKLQFENKNSVGGTLQAKNIHVFVDSIDVATISSEPFNVPSKKEFELPLQVKIPFSKVYADNKKSILENILNAVASKKVIIEIKGDIAYDLGVTTYDYPIYYKEKINLVK